MGTLRIHGAIDIAQFWPVGTADADTTKIKLEVNANSFEYRKEGTRTFHSTAAFIGATAKGQVSKEVITTAKKTGAQTITVRLQGVDAPELHYRAAPLKNSPAVSTALRQQFNKINVERRQCFGESSTVALAKYLKKIADSSGIIKAVFETEVNEPSDAIDTYGRFVGNITVNKKIDINVWLVENGWGHPSFYTSMSADEINIFLTAWKKGKTKLSRPGKSLSKDAGKFNWKLLYNQPKKGVVIPFTPGEDKGKVLMPKIFRRQVSWMVAKKAGVIASNTKFKEYLQLKPDQLVMLNDFLENTLNSAEVKVLDEFVTSKNIVIKSPEDFVFKEKPSTLVNANGKKITLW